MSRRKMFLRMALFLRTVNTGIAFSSFLSAMAGAERERERNWWGSGKCSGWGFVVEWSGMEEGVGGFSELNLENLKR